MARKPPEINASSMADIAFLLLIFFLVTTTMDVDSGIMRSLPPPVDKNAPIPPVNKSNVFIVLINSADQFFVNGKPGDLKTLREEAKDFLTPRFPEMEGYPEVKEIELPFFGKYYKSRGIISLQNDRGTSYKTYIHVQNELAAAVRELRDEFTKSKTSYKTYEELYEKDEIRAKAVAEAIPVSISEAEPVNFSDSK